MKFKKNIPLENFTTFKIGGRARYFCIAKNQKEIIDAIKKAKEFNLPFFILGGGSNLLVSDKGYKGIVIKYQIGTSSSQARANIKYQKDGKIYAGAGAALGKIVNLAQEKSLTGLEWAAGIPGTLGGAIYGNVGWPSNKKNISSILRSIEVLDMNKGFRIKKFNFKDCYFDYRDSIFKKNKNLIILGAFLQLKKGDKIKIKKEIAGIIKTRKNKIPVKPSAGCIFKNQKSKIKNQKLLKEYPELKEFNKKGMIPTSYLIDRCGLKGKIIGNAQISKKHANFIVNLGGAKSEDVIKLIKATKQKVKNKFGIKLEEEIQYLGF